MATPASGAERCGICLELPGDSRGQLDSCAHAFCAQCILDWAQVESKCPVCRARFTSVTRPGEQPVAVARTNQVYEWDGNVFADESDELDHVVCDVCGQGDREDELLLCRRFELCGASAHASCLGLAAPPEEDWECFRCAASTRRRARVCAARASALASPAATGVSPEEQARLSGEYLPLSGDVLDLEAPPSPREDEQTVRGWVARQRSIARSSLQSGNNNADSSRAALRTASLQTLRHLRDNWDALRSGSITFDAVGAGAPGARHPGALRLRQATAATTREAPADASQLSWQALEQLRQTEERRRRAPRGQQRARAAPSAPAQPTDGFLAHLSGMRRMREGQAEDGAQRRRQAPRPVNGARPQAATEAGPAQPRPSVPTHSFVIPRKK